VLVELTLLLSVAVRSVCCSQDAGAHVDGLAAGIHAEPACIFARPSLKKAAIFAAWEFVSWVSSCTR